MKRRNFLKSTAALLPFAIGGFPIRVFGRNPMFESLAPLADCPDRVLVLIQLAGGNDGLNTVIPLDQYSNYQKARTAIAVPQAQVLKLTNETGLHPKLAQVKNLYTAGKIAVLQSVGYDTPNFSHFRSTDIWLTGSDYDQYISTGWMGRYLQGEFPGFPVGFPNATMPHPLAIQVGSIISPALESATANMGMAFSNPLTYYNIVKDGTGNPPANAAGAYTDYVRDVGVQIENFATPVKNAAASVSIKSGKWPAINQNVLADQMKIVAQLIAGGLKTRVYIVTLGGFDTHTNQNTDATGTSKNYSHPQLLGFLNTAIDAFQDELKLQNKEDNVIGMTFSEFGRRIYANSGTDHGASAPLVVFGTNVNAGVFGPNPVIPSNVTVNDNVPMHYDFRSVYASLLKDWFCADEQKIRDVLFKDFQIIPFIKGSTAAVEPTPTERGQVAIESVYPNPFVTGTTVNVRTMPGASSTLSLFDFLGKEVRTSPITGTWNDVRSISFDVEGLPSGNYYLRLASGNLVATKAVSIVR